ncbi:phosphatase PAP2 family protein [Salegentibacter chungangensis]|uniref:Phosphatase PAP2 family protein n=1 Tax=Salegentibacter chungangensis TaxID=1335724 RepID=A0ABW3NXP8_9FLAO
MWDQIREWDRELFVFLNGLGIESYDQFWIFVTNPRHWIPLYIALFIIYFTAYHWKKALFTGLFLLAAFFTTYGLTNAVKNLATRLRPNNNPDLSDLIRILDEPSNYSFFSGHASSSFVVTTFVVLSLREKYRWIYIMYLWPILFVMSRIYVGVHYPGDILVGTLVGVLIAYIFFRLYERTGKRFI